MTQTYPSSKATTAQFIPREASAAGWLRSNAVIGELDFGRFSEEFVVGPPETMEKLPGLRHSIYRAIAFARLDPIANQITHLVSA